ncbi:MAG: zinc-binding dehydrogenase [Methanobacterium sp.]
MLIHGGAGGVGTFAVQLDHWKGAQVFATAPCCDMGYLDKLGAQGIINYHAIPFESVVKNMDLVFDLIGGHTQTRSFSVIREGGRLISTVQQPFNKYADRNKIFTMMIHLKPSAKRLSHLVELLNQRKLKPFVSRTFSLAETKKAWTHMVNNHKHGKIVMVIP